MRSTSRAPPFTEKWFWFKADPQRTGAYAYASERVHSISFICRIIAVFLFAAQGRANARVHEPKVSSSALHRGCAASVILPTRHRASMLVFARPFSSRREIRLSFFFPLEQEKKIYWNERKVSSGKEDSFSRVLCVSLCIESWKVSFLGLYLIIFGSRNFLIFLLSCYYCYYYFFLKTNPSVSCEVNFLMQFFVDKSSITRTFFLFSYSCI